MSLDQLKAFLTRMKHAPALRQAVQAAATADDVTQIAGKLGYAFCANGLLQRSSLKVGRVTVTKQDVPEEYNYLQSGPPHFMPGQQRISRAIPRRGSQLCSLKWE